jgi:hypothetical protein
MAALAFFAVWRWMKGDEEKEEHSFPGKLT